MVSSVICRLVILLFGTLYPAYASYKAVRTKNIKDYVKWMMYWIVFALFTTLETFTDVLLFWFPFYYELKIGVVIWLLSPATKGSSILYRKLVHPALCSREQDIDELIERAKDQGYHTVLNLGTKGVNYATTIIMETAIKNLKPPTEQDNIIATVSAAPDQLDGVVEVFEEFLKHPSEDLLDLDADLSLSSTSKTGRAVTKKGQVEKKPKKPHVRSGVRTRRQLHMEVDEENLSS